MSRAGRVTFMNPAAAAMLGEEIVDPLDVHDSGQGLEVGRRPPNFILAPAMRAMAKLRPSVDAFFDKVTVNVDDPPLRENRLKLLNEIRAATRAVADFSKIEG